MNVELERNEIEALAYAARELAENYRINAGNCRVLASHRDKAPKWDDMAKEFERLSKKMYEVFNSGSPALKQDAHEQQQQ